MIHQPNDQIFSLQYNYSLARLQMFNGDNL